jgi:hypothetical protein
MKLFLIEVHFKNKRRRRYGVDLIVHANSKAAAENLVRGKYLGCTVAHLLQLKGDRPKRFVIADLVEE